MIVALPRMGTFGVWYTLAFALGSSSVGRVGRTFQHRSAWWQDWHIVFGQDLNPRVVRSPLRIQTQALYELGSIFGHFFQFRKLRLALTMSRSFSLQFLGTILILISAAHLARQHTLLAA